jgi:hypothetical protein
MTVYFFHLRSHDLLLEDGEGTDLPSLQAALLQVLQTQSELAAEPETDVGGLAFEITDSSRRLLLRVPVGADLQSRPSTLQPKPRMDAGHSSMAANRPV